MQPSSDKTIKISKYLADCGVASRRKSEELVKQGSVFVNGQKMANVAKRIDPKTDAVEYLGKQIKPVKHVYYLLNKPPGYTSTTRDAHADKLIIDLVPKSPAVWPVGRLDRETSGLIILTNDGEFANRLAHPRYNKTKEYEITTNKPLNEDEIKNIQNGLMLEDGFIKPDRFEVLGPKTYRIAIHSGKKRVIRRLIEKVGKQVADLKRTRIDLLALGGLKPGEWRELTNDEVSRLRKLPH